VNFAPSGKPLIDICTSPRNISGLRTPVRITGLPPLIRRRIEAVCYLMCPVAIVVGLIVWPLYSLGMISVALVIPVLCTYGVGSFTWYALANRAARRSPAAIQAGAAKHSNPKYREAWRRLASRATLRFAWRLAMGKTPAARS
jgi:hypothetical protein